MSDDADVLHVWTVHGRAQAVRLQKQVGKLAPVFWNVMPEKPLPQYAPADDKRLACARGWGRAWRRLCRYDAEGLILVDDDITFRPGLLARLVEVTRKHDAGVASALTLCADRRLPLFSFDPPERWPRDRHLPGVTPVDAVGTFAMFLAGDTFALMRDGSYQPAVETSNSQFLGFDLHLCEWLKQHGVKVVVDTDERVQHHVEVGPGAFHTLEL